MVELVGYGSGEADAWQDFGQFAVRTQVVVNLNGSIVVETVGVVEHISGKLHSRDVEVKGTIGGCAYLHKLAHGDGGLMLVALEANGGGTRKHLIHTLAVPECGDLIAIPLGIAAIDTEGIP